MTDLKRSPSFAHTDDDDKIDELIDEQGERPEDLRRLLLAKWLNEETE